MSTIFKLLACCSLLLFVDTIQAQLDVMTYNLRYATERDGDNAWSKREADVAALISYYNPALLGVQEATYGQMKYLDHALTSYAYVGRGRDDGATKGEYSAIFFDSTQLKALVTETFWLSETPEEPSFGWGAEYRRVCTYGSFIQRASGDTLHVFNAHFDHQVALARLNGAQVIMDRVKAHGLVNSKVIVMGDFNCTAEDPPMQRFATEFAFGAVISVATAYGPAGTFTGFNTEATLDKTIDHVLVKNLKVAKYRHIDDRRPNGLWPSDHLPVLAEIWLE